MGPASPSALTAALSEALNFWHLKLSQPFALGNKKIMEESVQNLPPESFLKNSETAFLPEKSVMSLLVNYSPFPVALGVLMQELEVVVK
jgi:hypothetical protein